MPLTGARCCPDEFCAGSAVKVKWSPFRLCRWSRSNPNPDNNSSSAGRWHRNPSAATDSHPGTLPLASSGRRRTCRRSLAYPRTEKRNRTAFHTKRSSQVSAAPTIAQHRQPRRRANGPIRARVPANPTSLLLHCVRRGPSVRQPIFGHDVGFSDPISRHRAPLFPLRRL